MKEHIRSHVTIEQICKDNLVGRSRLQKIFKKSMWTWHHRLFFEAEDQHCKRTDPIQTYEFYTDFRLSWIYLHSLLLKTIQKRDWNDTVWICIFDQGNVRREVWGKLVENKIYIAQKAASDSDYFLCLLRRLSISFYVTRLTAQTMHFSIHNTERESSKCFYKFLQRFPDRELLYFQRFFCFNWWAPGRAARCHIPTYPPASPLSQIKSGAVLKKLRRRKPVIILWNEFAWKNSSKYRNVQVFALMHKMLLSEHLCEFSISVSFLAKFCTPAYLRSSELSLI